MSAPAAERIYDAAVGVPNDVQLLAFWAFAVGPSAIEEETVEVAVAAAISDQREEFTALFDGLTLVQQRLLKLLARGPISAVTGQAVQATIRASHRSAADAAAALERAQLAERSGNQWSIANGLLGEWLRGHYE
jgi:hypothetical protein